MSINSQNVPGKIAFCMAIAIFLSSCSLTKHFDRDQHSPPDFPGLQSGADEIQAVDDIDVLYLSDDVKRFLDYHVGRTGNDFDKLEKLRNTFVRSDLLAIRYDQFRTQTAMQTFRSRRGDCVSFSNLYVAMARYVGIKADFQDVMIPLDWDMSGNINILNKHINVSGRIGNHDTYVMDILPYQNNIGYFSKRISDNTARAQYFSNIGIVYMQNNDDTMALAYLKRAALIDPELELVWTNAGAVYSRNNQYDTAEKFYQYALLINSSDMTALNNMASLFEKKGDLENTRLYLDRIEKYRLKNPYYRYQMAFSAYQSGDYKISMNHLKSAIQKEKSDSRLYAALAKVYYQMGYYEEAEENLTKAKKYSMGTVKYDKPLAELAKESWFES